VTVAVVVLVSGDRAVGEHGRSPRFDGTFGARAIQLYSASPVLAPEPVIPPVLKLLGPPASRS
jgi:hypothetical protein